MLLLALSSSFIAVTWSAVKPSGASMSCGKKFNKFLASVSVMRKYLLSIMAVAALLLPMD